jgi:DNA-binding transcriptional ArsR family regulator
MDPCAGSKMAESARGFVGDEDGSVAPIASVRDPLARTPSVTYPLRLMHVLDALGNPVRRAILQELRGGPRAVGEIAAGLPVSRPAVSRHLRVLEDAGLVQAREEGARNIYSIRMQGFASVREFVDDFWDTALARLEELARR